MAELGADMAERVNLVDATAQVADRMAKTRSAVVRIGTVKTVANNGLVTVTVGGASSGSPNFDGFDVLAGYLVGYQPQAGDVVALLRDRDMWQILGRAGNATTDSAPPLPWAVSTGRISLGTLAANSGAGVTLTFPTGRFTQQPAIAVCVESSGYVFGCTAAMSVTGSTIRAYNPTAAAPTSVYANYVAVQMTPTSGFGFRAVDAPEGFSVVHVTCHTVGCLNQGETIPVFNEYPLTPVFCGVCGQPIDDIDSGTR